MGWGSWDVQSYNSYTTSSRGMDAKTFATSDSFTAQSMYVSRHLASELNPLKVMRECCDSDEHPQTLPVILALDVTGSMGGAAVRVAQKLNDIMTALYADESVKDIEFCVMGIGDLRYDDAPIQISQFESDIRIAEQLDKIYFEGGGGGNGFESYTAAWYMGTRHCKLDCWNRGQKGIIITLGDELPNPYLPKDYLNRCVGDNTEGVETEVLLEEVRQKYDVFHIAVDDRETSYRWYNNNYDEDKRWQELLGGNYFVATLDNLANTIVSIIKDRAAQPSFVMSSPTLTTNEKDEVTW